MTDLETEQTVARRMSSKFLFCVLFFFLLTFSSVKSDAGFDCKSNSNCTALAGYVSPNTTTLSNIASLFGVTDFNLLLAANNLPANTPKSKSVAVKETIRIPFVCSCKDDSGIANNTTVYKVKAGEFLDLIARSIFSLLVTYQEIAEVNGIANPNEIKAGDSLSIPIPCSCDSVGGNQVVHYAHVVAPKESLEMIGKEFGVQEKTLLELNGLDNAKDLKAESVLDVPLRVCTSMVKNTSSDFPMLASNGTKCDGPGGSPQASPSIPTPSAPAPSGSPSMNLQGWSILWLTMSLALLFL